MAYTKAYIKEVLLGLDCGKIHFGFSVVQIEMNGTKFRIKVLQTGEIQNLLDDLKVPARQTLNKHVAEINAKVKKYNIM